MRTTTCMWAVPWKGGGTAARLKGEGLGTDHATWLIGRRCVARGPYCVASSSLGSMVPVLRVAAQRGPVSRARVPVFVSENHRRMHRRRGCSKGAGSTGRGSGAWCAHATCGRSALGPPFTMRKEGL